MNRHFDEQLNALKASLLKMGDGAEWMIAEATQGLVTSSADRHAGVFAREREVNALQIDIDEQVIELLALQHPVAGDLRMAMMCSRMAGELERIADQAVNICQNTAVVLQNPSPPLQADLGLMAAVVRGMVHDSLDAFVRRDTALAQQVLNIDDRVDEMKVRLLRDALSCMKRDGGLIDGGLALILVSRNLERVGDHATNIAEEVIYLAQGRDVRHHHEVRRRPDGA
jgi:phosphate transport system protein